MIPSYWWTGATAILLDRSKYSGHGLCSQNKALRLLTVPISVWTMDLRTYVCIVYNYSVAFPGSLSASYLPLLPFQNTPLQAVSSWGISLSHASNRTLAFWPLFHYDQLFEKLNQDRHGEKPWSKLRVPPSTGPHLYDSLRPCHNNRNSVDLHAHPSVGAGERQQLLNTIMIISRDLYSSPPRAKSKAENNATLLVSWWCTGFALAIIVVRLAGRYTRTEKLFREDKIMALSIIPLLARMGLVHVVLIWGTNNAITAGLTPLDIEHREIGSRVVLASRIMYAAL